VSDDLVARAQAGDQTAFRELYRQHAGRVYALCLRLTGDGRDAEERTQDVFVRLWDKLRSFRGDSAFSSWRGKMVRLLKISVGVAALSMRSYSSSASSRG